MIRRVLFLEHSTDGTVGGSHYCLLEICRHLDKGRFRPVVCFFEHNSLVEDFKAVGAEVLIVRLPDNWSASAGLPRPLARLVAFPVNLVRTLIVRALSWMRLLRRERIDLVHINNACGYDHDLMLAAKLCNLPCVVHERGILPVIDGRTRLFSRLIDRIIAISDAVAENLIRQGISVKRIVRIDDGIDPQRFAQRESESSVRSRFSIQSGDEVIGIVGNVKQWKGQHVVVEALGLLRPSHPQLKCLLVGSKADPSYCDRLVARAKELDIPEHALIFTGYEPHPADLMRIMDVVIHASVEPEPFGIVLLEAMGVRRPLIATDLGGPREIVVQDETGIRVPPNDPHALGMAIERLLNHPDRAEAMGRNGQARYHSRYRAKDNVVKIEHLYAELCRDGPA